MDFLGHLEEKGQKAEPIANLRDFLSRFLGGTVPFFLARRFTKNLCCSLPHLLRVCS